MIVDQQHCFCGDDCGESTREPRWPPNSCRKSSAMQNWLAISIVWSRDSVSITTISSTLPTNDRRQSAINSALRCRDFAHNAILLQSSDHCCTLCAAKTSLRQPRGAPQFIATIAAFTGRYFNRRSRFCRVTWRRRGGCGAGRRRCRVGGRVIGRSRMHEGIDARIGHDERDDNRPNESARADQPLQSSALCFIQADQSGVQVGITFFHGEVFQ